MQRQPKLITRTECPENYLSPIQYEMDLMAKRIGINFYSPLLVTDLSHVAAGGVVLPEDIWIPQLRDVVDQTLEPPNEKGEWITSYNSASETTNYREKVIDLRTRIFTKYHNRICEFMAAIEFDKIPGRSPLEKAMNVLKLLTQEQGGEPKEEGHTPYKIFGEPEGEDGDGDTEAQDGVDVAEAIHAKLDSADEIDNIESELLSQDTDKKGGEQAGVGTASDLKRMALATDMESDKKIWLDVSRDLETNVKMEVSKSVKFVPDMHGNEVRVRPIANFGELPKVQASEYALPRNYRMYRAVSKVSPIRERVSRETKQQLLYMIIDSSGSMGSMGGDRIAKAGGVLMNRLKAVIKGDANVLIRFFDDRLFKEHVADTPEKAKKLMKQFEKHNFSGGGTDIAGCAKKAQKRIEKLLEKNKVLTRPELVIVTDGIDTVSALNKDDFMPTRVHAFIVDGNNKELIDFAKSTGGVGVNL